jgi:LCP family protein required for cell wall assembly
MSVTSNPIRYPNTSNPKIMTTRGWWLLVFNLVFPGSVQALAGNRRLGRVGMASTLAAWAVLIIAAVMNAISPVAIYNIATNGIVLFLVQVACVYYAILWLVLTFDTLRLVRIIKTGPRARFWIPGVAIVLVALLAGSTTYAATLAGGVNGLLSKIGVAGPAVEPVDGRYNILVLGVDSNSERAAANKGMRPDTVQVLSIDATTGRVISLGFPRDLHDMPFPASSPMHKLYPNGYTEADAPYCVEWACLNTVYVDAEVNHPELYPRAKKAGVSPGVFAMMDAASGITGLTMQFYTIIDMTGVIKLIDALGGVDIVVDEKVGIAKMGVPDSQVTKWIPAGKQHLNGSDALAYARSRHAATGDYDRMARQQKLIAALQKQMNPSNVLSKFQQISEAGGQVLKTNIPTDMFGTLVDLAVKSKKAGFVGVAFTPYSSKFKINAHQPNYDKIQAYIQSLIHVASPSASPKN